jgi:hypothetical protein
MQHLALYRASQTRTGDPESPRLANPNIRLMRLHAFSVFISISGLGFRQVLIAGRCWELPGLPAVSVVTSAVTFFECHANILLQTIKFHLGMEGSLPCLARVSTYATRGF